MAKKQSTATRIETVLKELATIEKKMQQRVKKLERQGCENMNLHIKAGTNKMFHRGGTPDPKTGKRDYRYIGTDPKKQQAALDSVRRYQQRENLFHALRKIKQQQEALAYRLQDLAEDAQDMLDGWTGSQLELLG